MSDNPTGKIYETLTRAYGYFNDRLFKGQLPQVIITFHRQSKVMGYASIGRWVSNERQYVDELGVNPEYFAKYPLMEICQTLCHEMVHIWQAHYGNPGRRGYHNAQWAQKMVEIGLIPSSTGKPGGQKTGEWMMDYVLYGGRFHRACQHLLNAGYSLPWFDRYPVYRLELPVVAYDDEGTCFELDSTLEASSTGTCTPVTAMKAERSRVELASESAAVSTRGAFLPDEAFGFDDRLSELVTSKPRPKSGRVKYACKACHIQLWGKPGLNVRCGDCELTLIEVI